MCVCVCVCGGGGSVNTIKATGAGSEQTVNITKKRGGLVQVRKQNPAEK